MRFADLVDVSRSVAETSGRLEKIDRLASLLTRLDPDEIEVAIGFLSGLPRQGRLGVGASAVAAARDSERDECERRVRVWRGEPVPEQHLSGHELLGGRGIRGRDPADRDAKHDADQHADPD